MQAQSADGEEYVKLFVGQVPREMVEVTPVLGNNGHQISLYDRLWCPHA